MRELLSGMRTSKLPGNGSVVRIAVSLPGRFAPTQGILEAHEQRYVRNKAVGYLHCEEGRWPIDLSGENTFGHR
jgi:hypothetical protein